ncbi:FAD synthase [Micractinium conductrix]|uniref:FAD synthase n=1 Tax=Micractinium conductrix TaxID=554055 RepID=A0A2P6V034_9CHLO|nr:FAD synthase [Micractinium conductrix]|eukprot:PSC67404.1 FAD synthase [Micractinium conductrix]
MDVLDAIENCEDSRLKARCLKAVAVVLRSLDLYGTRGVAFSFNGGKDSTVLLHLIRAATAQRRRVHEAAAGVPNALADDLRLGGLLTFFFHHDSDFPEVLEFTHSTSEQYTLGMEIFTGDFKTGLEELLQQTHVQAIVLGTRRGDPNAADQETFCPSSTGWPPFMRINPILGWSYHDVWSFLQLTGVPYCCLYDQGYTSLGSVANTEPNAALRKEDGSYAPAHMLPDARLERAGRQLRVQKQDSLAGEKCKTAGLLIIGDEILSAKVEDVNTRFLCQELRAIGWRVGKVVVVGGEVDTICREVRALSCAYDIVLTAGGLGPTLDDVTMAALAEALDQQLALHPQLESRIRAYFGANTTRAHLKMAEAPTGSEVQLIEYRLEGGALSPFPLLRCRNIFVLPGIPALLQKKWRAVEAHLLAEAPQLAPFRTALLRLRLSDETQVAAALEAVAAAEGEEVQLGSYPVSGQVDGAGIVLCLESRSCDALDRACQRLKGMLPQGAVISEHLDAGAINSPAPGGSAADGGAATNGGAADGGGVVQQGSS